MMEHMSDAEWLERQITRGCATLPLDRCRAKYADMQDALRLYVSIAERSALASQAAKKANRRKSPCQS